MTMTDEELFAADPAVQRASPEQVEYGSVYAEAFATPAGRMVLGHMARRVLSRRVCGHEPEGILREIEGQRALLADTVNLIERHRNPTHPRPWPEALVALLSERT